jgi:hypothetical protein
MSTQHTPLTTYPLVIKNIYTQTLGAGAETTDIELPQAPIAAIILQWDMLGQGAAATVASAKTQIATYLKVTDGGVDVTPNWSGAEWYDYLSAYYGHIVPFQDGTAADNKLALMAYVIPFGRPLATRHGGLLVAFDPLVGFVPKGTPLVHIESPADGNAIDTRHLKVGAVMYRGKPSYTKKWTGWASQTLSTTGAKDWILPSAGQLIEAFIYQTTAYNDTLTADAPSLLNFDVTQNGKSILTDGQMFNCLGALLDSTAQPDDDYLHLPFVQNTGMDLSLAPQLGPDTRFKAYGGVADALTAAFATVERA